MINYLPVDTNDVTNCVIVVFASLVISVLSGRFVKVSWLAAVLLLMWHLLFAFYYARAMAFGYGDSAYYFISSFDRDIPFNLGTSSIRIIVHFFSVDLGFTFLATSLVFSLFGTLGSIAFLGCLQQVSKSKYLNYLIVFLPTGALWTSAIGKDGLAFLAISVFCLGVLSARRFAFYLATAIFLGLLARPHIAILMLAASFLVLLTRFTKSPVVATAAILGSVLAASLSLTFLQQRLKIDEISVSEIEDAFEKQSKSNLGGGSSFDVSELAIPLRPFSYLFRPLIFEARNGQELIVALESTLHLLVIGLLFVKVFRGANKPFVVSKFSMVAFAMAVLLTLSFTNSNLGISVRQRWMILVPLYVFLFGATGRQLLTQQTANWRKTHGSYRPTSFPR